MADRTELTLRDRVYAEIDGAFPQTIEALRRLVQQPSVAATQEGISDCAQMVAGMLREIGCRVEIWSAGEGSPVVFGKLPSDRPGAKTVIMYGMYDVQPPEPLDEWKVPPYSATIMDVPPYGPCMVGRGVTNSKGPLVTFIRAVAALKRVMGSLPINVWFVVEGEEEMGSEALHKFVHARAAELAAADAVYLHGARSDEKGKPMVLLGNKGIAYFELEATGGSWGGPSKIDIHAMNAAWVDSAAWRLIGALATMRSGSKILIEGFEDDVMPPSETDEAFLAELSKSFDEPMFKERLGITRFMDDATGVDALRKFLFTPTLNIDGIWGGYTGPATKTIMPYRARVKIDVRLVPNMEPESILKKVREHLDRHGYSDIRIIVRQGETRWSKTDPGCPAARAAIEAMRESEFGPGEVWPLLPGSGPAHMFTRSPLHLPFVSYGLGHGGRIHAPNEYFVVDGIRHNVRSAAAYLLKYMSIEGMLAR